MLLGGGREILLLVLFAFLGITIVGLLALLVITGFGGGGGGGTI